MYIIFVSSSVVPGWSVIVPSLLLMYGTAKSFAF